MQYEIKRNNTIIAIVRPESGEQKKEIMLTDIVSMGFSLPAAVHFQHGDYVAVWGETYYLNELAEPEKRSSIDHKYSMTFQAAWYDLVKPLFFFYDSVNVLWSQSEFQLMCTANEALNLVIANANREQTGWIKGDVDATTAKQLPFTGQETVLQALTQIAQAFDLEWWIIGKAIHLTKKGGVSGYHFEYGRNKGIRGGLKRTNVDATGAFSRLYVRGSDQNLPFNYRGGQNRLILPAPLPYLQGPKYGPYEIERAVTFEDIKPERTGIVTAVGDKYTFTDSALDFDINLQLIAGTSAKITFQTGQCAGYEFEIAKGGYNHATKTITILKNEMEKAFEMPSDLLKPAIGDEYILSDVNMPDSYVTAAEGRLLDNGQDYFDLNSPPKVTYSIPPDQFYFERNNIEFVLGDYVSVKDLDLGIDKNIRVTSYSRDLHNKYKYTQPVIVSDTVKGAVYNAVQATAEKAAKAVSIAKIPNIQRSRRNWKTTGELTTILNTVKAEMLLIMMEGGAYSTNIIATVAVGSFGTTAGRVVHEQYNQGNGIWDVTAFTGSLASDVPYYVYIKAGRVTGAAVIVVSDVKIAVESDPSYYYFPFGVISSIIDGDRLFTSIRGYTRVTGDTITTGRIVSSDGLNFFDLNNGKFNLGDNASGLDWSVTTDGKLSIRGDIEAIDARFINLVVQTLKTAAVGSKRVEIDATENNIKLLDADNNALIVIDDDAAIVSMTINPDPPHDPVYHYGPGIMIGDISGDYLSLAKNGIKTNKDIEADKITSNNKLIINGDVLIKGFSGALQAGISNDDIRYDYGGGTYKLVVKNGLIIGQEHV
jgi:hypothetical protein